MLENHPESLYDPPREGERLPSIDPRLVQGTGRFDPFPAMGLLLTHDRSLDVALISNVSSYTQMWYLQNSHLSADERQLLIAEWFDKYQGPTSRARVFSGLMLGISLAERHHPEPSEPARVVAHMGVPAEIINPDGPGSNYSSARVAEQQFMDEFGIKSWRDRPGML